MPTQGFEWVSWNSYATTATTINHLVWNNWTVGTTTTNTSLYYDTWSSWNETANDYANDSLITWNRWLTAPAHVTPYRERVGAAVVRTEAEWDAIRAENERLREERDKLEAAARAEARKLLEFVLTKEQLACYDRNRYFDVVGSAGTVFRVHHGTSGNVRQLVDGREVNALCAHPNLYDAENRGYLPTEDCLAAQALALMHDESQFLAVANVHRGPRHLAVVREAA